MSTETFSLLTSSNVFDTDNASQYTNYGKTTSDPNPCNFNDLAIKGKNDPSGSPFIPGTNDLICSSKPSPSQTSSSCPAFGPAGSIKAIDSHYNLPTNVQDGGCYLTSTNYSSGPSLAGGSVVPLVCTYNYNDVIANFTEGDANNFLKTFTKSSSTPSCTYQYLDDPNVVYNKIMSNWCSQQEDPLDTYTPIRLTTGSSSLTCKEWCKGNTGACSQIYLEYCGGTNKGGSLRQFVDPECSGPQGFCATTDQCDAILTDYCQKNLSPEEALSTPMCGCAMPQSFYENYFGSLTKDYNISSAVTEELPQCFYAPCAASAIKLSTQKGGQCPSVSNCIQVSNVDIDGTIKGGIQINQEGQCSSLISPKNQTTKYSCGTSGCVESDDGEYDSKEDCEKECGTKKSYSCSGGACVEDASGVYHSLEECQSSCSKPKRKIPLYVIYAGVGVVVLILLIIGVKFFRK